MGGNRVREEAECPREAPLRVSARKQEDTSARLSSHPPSGSAVSSAGPAFPCCWRAALSVARTCLLGREPKADALHGFAEALGALNWRPEYAPRRDTCSPAPGAPPLSPIDLIVSFISAATGLVFQVDSLPPTRQTGARARTLGSPQRSGLVNRAAVLRFPLNSPVSAPAPQAPTPPHTPLCSGWTGGLEKCPQSPRTCAFWAGLPACQGMRPGQLCAYRSRGGKDRRRVGKRTRRSGQWRGLGRQGGSESRKQ